MTVDLEVKDGGDDRFSTIWSLDDRFLNDERWNEGRVEVKPEATSEEMEYRVKKTILTYHCAFR